MAQEYRHQTVTNMFSASSAGRRWRSSAGSILLSILVGVILAAIGLDPWNIIESVRQLVQHIWNMGFDAVRWLWQYFLLGAVIVCRSGCWYGSPRRRAAVSAARPEGELESCRRWPDRPSRRHAGFRARGLLRSAPE